MTTVKILMSTYNGEKFLREQLDSILSQKGLKVDVNIRDDGSSDKTRAILEEYEMKYPNIHIIFGENIGPSASFIKLLYSSDKGYDYYAFCDQDDIWEEDKILHAANYIEKQDIEKPALYYSALNTFNSVTGERILIVNQREFSFEETFFQSHYPGCTMVLNQSAFNLIRELEQPEIALMHDLFVVQVMMSTHNTIIYDRESYINYRIHKNNVSVKPNVFLGEAKRIYKILRNQKGVRYLSAKAINRSVGINIQEPERHKLEIIISYKDSIRQKCELIRMIQKTGFNIKMKIAYQLAVIFNFF